MKTTFKNTLLSLALLAGAFTALAQVKVGDSPTTINAGSVLELQSTNKGLLMPRISLTNTTTWGLAGTPAAGMHVYNTNMGITSSNTAYPTLNAKIGEYYWDGTGWVALASAAKLPGSAVMTSGAQPIFNVTTPIDYTAAPYNPDGIADVANNRFVIQHAGWYTLSFRAWVNIQGVPGGTPPGWCSVWIEKNGVDIGSDQDMHYSNYGVLNEVNLTLIKLEVGDIIKTFAAPGDIGSNNTLSETTLTLLRQF